MIHGKWKTLVILLMLVPSAMVAMTQLAMLFHLPATASTSVSSQGMRGVIVVLGASPYLGPTVRNYTIIVGYTGFNSTYSNGITLNATEGDTVDVHFIYNSTDTSVVGPNNPHDICFEPCDSSTPETTPHPLDSVNTSYTASFVVNQVGQIGFYCTRPACTGHAHLLNGIVNVAYIPGVAAPTTITLSTSAITDGVNLTAHIVSNNAPVPGVLIHFYRDSIWGFAELGTRLTDSSGTASYWYKPPAGGLITFQAMFLGTSLYEKSSQTQSYNVNVNTPDGFPYVLGQNTGFDLRIVGTPASTALIWVSLGLVVVASVWVTYAYVLRQVFGIWRVAKPKPTMKSPSPIEEGDELARKIPSIPQEPQSRASNGISYPAVVLTAIVTAGLGAGSFLLLSFFLTIQLSILALPLAALAEALLLMKLLSILFHIE